jgi:hypothetical protein
MTHHHTPAAPRLASARPDLFLRPTDTPRSSAAEPPHINVLDALANELPPAKHRNWRSHGALFLSFLSLLLIAILSVLVWRDPEPSTQPNQALQATPRSGDTQPAAAQLTATAANESAPPSGLPARVETTVDTAPANPLSSLSESPAATVPIGSSVFQTPSVHDATHMRHAAGSSRSKASKAAKPASKAPPTQAQTKGKEHNPLAALNTAPASKRSPAADTDVMIIEALMTTPAAKNTGKTVSTPSSNHKPPLEARADPQNTFLLAPEQQSAVQAVRSKLADSASEKANELGKEKAAEAGDKLLNKLKLTP